MRIATEAINYHATSWVVTIRLSFIGSSDETSTPATIADITLHTLATSRSIDVAMHCHLRSPVPPVVHAFNHEPPTPRSVCTHVPNFSKIGQFQAELLMI